MFAINHRSNPGAMYVTVTYAYYVIVINIVYAMYGCTINDSNKTST